jgi:RNA polymerase sigma factor (sigma-70 family)
MAKSGMGVAIRQLDSLLRAGSMAGLSDADLLDRVIAADCNVASVAFEALIRRHGPMVLATCRGALRNEHDAEDVFQATFLVLIRRSRSLRSGNSLGPWLHRVAIRASERARAQEARRRVREANRVELLVMERERPGCDAEREELCHLIHHEVDCLAERYRVVLVLCDLQGERYERAAAILGLPVGTIRSRLARARERLRDRMVRRGLALPAGLLAAVLTDGESSAGVRAHLITSTISLAKLRLADGLAVGTASAGLIAHANGLVNSLGLTNLGRAALAIALLGVGIGLTGVGSGLTSLQRQRESLPAGSTARLSTAGVNDSQRGHESIQGRTTTASDQVSSRVSLAQLLEEARRSASALRDARARSQMLLAVALGQAKAGDQTAARAAFAEAIQAAGAIEDLSSRVFALQDIAASQLDSHDRDAARATTQRAFEIIGTMGNEFRRNDARIWIVRSYARAGELDTALRIVRELPEANMLRSRALANALEGLKQYDARAAQQLLPTFLAIAESTADRTHWAECMGFIAGVLTDAGDVGELTRIADKLETLVAEFGLQDNRGHFFLHSQVLVLAALAKAQTRAGNLDAAVATFDRAEALGSIMPSEGEGLRSDRLSRVAGDRAGAGNFDGALRTAERIVYEYHKAIALMHIGEAQAKVGRRDEARALFGKAVQTAREIKIRDPLRDRPANFDLNSFECLRTIAAGQARAGFSADALHTAETIEEPKWKNSALAMISVSMAKRGEIKPAIQLADRVEDEKSKSTALQGIAEAQAKSGGLGEALEWARNRATPEARADALLGIVRAITNR